MNPVGTLALACPGWVDTPKGHSTHPPHHLCFMSTSLHANITFCRRFSSSRTRTTQSMKFSLSTCSSDMLYRLAAVLLSSRASTRLCTSDQIADLFSYLPARCNFSLRHTHRCRPRKLPSPPRRPSPLRRKNGPRERLRTRYVFCILIDPNKCFLVASSC